MEHVRTNIPPVFPGMDEIIRRQKENGGLICVVSHSSIENITRDYGLYFNTQPDDIFGWDLPEEKRKPNLYPLQQIMRKYDLAPNDILVVDDMKLAWQMAHPLGVPIAFAAWGKTEFPEISEKMRQLCDYSFDSTKDLAKFLFD